MPMFRYLFALALALLMTAAGAQDFVPVPPLQARVTDKVGMLTPDQRDNLENVLKEYEERTGSQIAILLVSKTGPEAIEQYGIRVADKWKLGHKGVDNGVILIVAKDNPPALRRLRIEAGRGVQGSLTDAQSKRILQDVIAPHFRRNDYYGGLVAGVSAITSLLDKEHFPAPNSAAQTEEQGSGFDLPLILFFIVMVLFIMLSRGGSSRRYRHRQDDWGRSAGVILGSGLGGGFGTGGFGGGSSGGGFSGGGGSFDGGGASGDW